MKNVNLSDSEWKLMNQLWDNAPQTITELVAELKDSTGWTKHTVITMLSRLEAKGAVRHEEGERAKRFYPSINRADTQFHETEHFLDRLYDGSLGLMLNTFMKERELSKEEIEELYAILQKAEEGIK